MITRGTESVSRWGECVLNRAELLSNTKLWPTLLSRLRHTNTHTCPPSSSMLWTKATNLPTRTHGTASTCTQIKMYESSCVCSAFPLPGHVLLPLGGSAPALTPGAMSLEIALALCLCRENETQRNKEIHGTENGKSKDTQYLTTGNYCTSPPKWIPAHHPQCPRVWGEEAPVLSLTVVFFPLFKWLMWANTVQIYKTTSSWILHAQLSIAYVCMPSM